jgi:hypothetical protein
MDAPDGSSARTVITICTRESSSGSSLKVNDTAMSKNLSTFLRLSIGNTSLIRSTQDFSAQGNGRFLAVAEETAAPETAWSDDRMAAAMALGGE